MKRTIFVFERTGWWVERSIDEAPLPRLGPFEFFTLAVIAATEWEEQ